MNAHLAVSLGVLFGIIGTARAGAKPIIEGKPLSYWVQALADKDDRVRYQAAGTLAKAGPPAVAATPALIKALKEGWIAGAGLDVLQVEPAKADNPLLGMPHVVLSPHNASASARFDPARKRRVGQEIALVLSGRWPMSCVNPTVLPASGLRRWQPVSMERGPNA